MGINSDVLLPPLSTPITLMACLAHKRVSRRAAILFAHTGNFVKEANTANVSTRRCISCNLLNLKCNRTFFKPTGHAHGKARIDLLGHDLIVLIIMWLNVLEP